MDHVDWSSFLFGLSIVADVAGVISFCLTIFLLIKSEALRKEIASQKQEYRRSQRAIKISMIALRNNLWEGQPLDLKLASEIRTTIYSHQQRFSRLNTCDDKKHFKAIIEMLCGPLDSVDMGKLCNELDYFIAVLERKVSE